MSKTRNGENDDRPDTTSPPRSRPWSRPRGIKWWENGNTNLGATSVETIIENLLQCQEAADSAENRHRERNFRGCRQLSIFWNGGMRHQSSWRLVFILSTPDHVSVPIFRWSLCGYEYDGNVFVAWVLQVRRAEVVTKWSTGFRTWTPILRKLITYC